MVNQYTLIVVIAFNGFLLASYIRHKKVSNEILVCPLKSNCETVIFSNYSKLFGIPVEILGILYYLTITLAYVFFLVVPISMPQLLVLGVSSLTVLAFLFSLYLTFVQAFALKQWCTWCLISAGLCTAIFSLVILAS